MEAATAPAWIRRVPNLLSASRFVLALAFPFAPPGWRLAAIAVAAVTDGCDGFVARRYDAQSTVGGLLDALADKAFVLAVLLTLAADGTVMWWEVVLVLTRDVVVALVSAYVAGCREWAAFKGMPARLLGKAATALLFLWFVALLLPAAAPARTLLFILAATSSALAALDYLLRFLSALRRRAS